MADVQSWHAGTTTVVGRLPTARSDDSAVTVGTTSYVLGGFDGSAMTRAILATRDGRSFRPVGQLRFGVRYAAVTAAGHDIYVVGGQLATTAGTAGGPQSQLVQRFDTTTGRTTVVARLPQPLGHAMAFTLSGAVYFAGGRTGTTAVTAVRRLDPATGRTTVVGRLPFGISDAATVVVGTTALLIGGETSGPYAPQRTIIAVRSAA
jgi:N-acetylneuraminic acid mutarotase